MKNPTKSPLKWAGGKARALKALLPHLAGENRLIEPFVGGGSVFVAFPEREGIINDANRDLIYFYQALKFSAPEFLHTARPLFSSSNCSENAYKRLRAQFNESHSSLERAALLLYLNRFGFNGLYRVNQKGIFNTPYGHLKSVPQFPEEQLLAMAERLQNVWIQPPGDFSDVIKLAGKGDIVYCDPPYVDVSSNEKSFTAYTATAFGIAEHERLVTEAKAAAGRGAKVVISNHDTVEARELYKDMELHFFDVRRSLAASSTNRKVVRELIAVLEK